MGRVVLLCNQPRRAARSLAGGLEAITPNRYAAAALDQPYLGLTALANQSLPRSLSVASGLRRRRVLRDIVAGLWPGEPSQRLCQWVEPALRRWLRAGLHQDETLANLPPRAAEVDHLAREYVAALARGNEVDSACAAWLAEGAVRRPRLVAGFPRLELGDLKLLDTTCADGSTIVLPYAASPLFADNLATARWLEARGWRIEERQEAAETLGERLSARWLGEPGDIAGCGRQDWPDAEAEARGVLAQAKRLIVRDGVRAGDIALVARRERDYGPLVAALAEELGLRVHIAYAVPLHETRLGWWLAQGLRALADDLPYEQTLRWLGARWHDLADDFDATQAYRRRPNGADDWTQAGAPSALVGVPQGKRPAAEWLGWLEGLLAQSTAIRRDDAREALAHRRLAETIVEARRQAPGVDWTLADFAEELGDWLETLTVPARPGRGGIELHTPLALLGAQRQHLFLLGATDGALPQPVADDAFLDFRDRETVNALVGDTSPVLETASQAARREALVCWSLLGAPTDSLCVTRPETAGNSATSPSAWLAPLALPELPRTPLLADRLSWRQASLRSATDEPVLHAARLAHGVEWRREGPEPPDAHDGAIGRPLAAPRRFSVSQLVALASCPFRWYGQRALGLAAPEETEADPDPATRGSALHRALELTLRAALDAGCLREPAALAELAELALDAAVGTEPPETPLGQAMARAKTASPARTAVGAERDDDELRADWLGRLPNWPRLRSEWVAMLRRAVARPGFLPPDATPACFEQRFGGDWQGLGVTGFIDRVDQLDSGELALIDYKTAARVAPGVPARDAWGKAFDLQVPLYGQVYSEHSGQPVARAVYLCRLSEPQQPAKPDDDSVYIAFVDWVCERFAAGGFAPDPDPAGNACRYCELDAVCRRGPRLDRKRG